MVTARKKRIKTCIGAVLAALIYTSGYGQAVPQVKAPDSPLLKKFVLLTKKISGLKGNYTLGGIININDPADPAGKMENVDFLMCKQGDEFYYKLGSTATLNGQGVYLFIDNKTKRILLSPKKQVEYGPGFQAFGELGANIKSENYALASKVNGDEETLSLVNEYHISCKQYSITFNRRGLKIKRLYMRLSNFRDPLSKDKEKTVDVRITRWENTADMGKYLEKSEVIKNINGRWVTVNGFKNYQLIKM